MSFFKKLFGRNKQQQPADQVDQPVLGQEELDIKADEAGQEHEAGLVEEARPEENTVALEAPEEKVQEHTFEAVEDESIEQNKAIEESPAHEEEDKASAQTEVFVEEVPHKEDAEETVIYDSSTAQESESEEAYEENLGLEAEEEETIQEETKDEEAAEPEKKAGFIKRLFSGLSKTRDSILKGVDDVLSNFKHIDEDLYEELEEALIMADFGVETTLHIMSQLKEKVKADKITDPAGLKPALQEIITEILTSQPSEEILNPEGPTVVLVIGVNGVGKTTSIGKMSHLFKSQHKKVLVAAADTFRAAAIEQLSIWTDRAGVEIIKHEEGSDAAAVVFDAISAAKSRKSDVLICDTAGRLQNKTNLMKELEKISRIIEREYPEAKKEILIVIDATTGQNAMQQVKLFKEVADISGIILTKLDGTAKGGAIVGIYESMKVPVKYIGVGEKMDDLQPFDAAAFAKALFESEA